MKQPGAYDSFVPNAASPDKFWAPDSTASRPNPESAEDRPRKPNQFVPTASEQVLNKEPS